MASDEIFQRGEIVLHTRRTRSRKFDVDLTRRLVERWLRGFVAYLGLHRGEACVARVTQAESERWTIRDIR